VLLKDNNNKLNMSNIKNPYFGDLMLKYGKANSIIE